MRFFRPRSLTGLMLFGFSLVTVPLLFAVITGTAKVRKLSEESSALVQSGVATTRQTQRLYPLIANMERSARFYQALKDKTFLTVYGENRDRFKQSLDEIAEAHTSDRRGAQLETLRQLHQHIDQRLTASSFPSDESMRDLLAAFDQLREATDKLAELTAAQIESGLSQLQARTAETQRYLFRQSAGMILLTALLVTYFTARLMRPIRQIDGAISNLGKGAFSKQITVSGPSDLVSLGRQLEWLRTRLLELAQERNKFLRHMSHELKTPLAAIRDGTELLMDGAVGPLESTQQEVVSILRDNSIRLQQLIENLLSFSAWQARHTGLEITDIRLRALIKSTLETHQLMALSSRVHLDLKVDDIEIRADRAKLKLILDNLVSNALKYSPRGGTIYLHARAENEQVILDVADTGHGIAPEERSAIFDAFYSGRAPQAGHLKGTGIGLSVVLEFVQAHNGSIEIVDNVFPGAHFRVRLPLAPSLEGATA